MYYCAKFEVSEIMGVHTHTHQYTLLHAFTHIRHDKLNSIGTAVLHIRRWY